MRSKGYLQARHGEPALKESGHAGQVSFLPLPFLSSVDEGLRVTVPIIEGKLYRIGEMKIEGNSIFSEDQIRAVIGLNKGDIANGEKIGKALFENLKKYYGAQGFIEYTAEPNPTFKDNPQNPNEGIVDFVVTIEEGKQFTLRRLEFIGNTFTRDNVLRREVLINEGDIYNQITWEYSVIKLNQLGYFDPIDKDKDADFRTNEEEATVDINLKVTERGRQQISFNGGISGIGGSFFGLEYSTNNLLGRGEILSFNLAAGNRQRSFQFSFTEPYIKNRPITAGFSLFAYTQKFFGEGTFLSQNLDAQQGLVGSQFDFLNVDEENLFTRDSYGGSLFLSAPLSEFYRKRPLHSVFARRCVVPVFDLQRDGSGGQRDPIIRTGSFRSSTPSRTSSRAGSPGALVTTRATRASTRPAAVNFRWLWRWPVWAATFAPTSRRFLTPSSFPMRGRSRNALKSLASASWPEQSAALRYQQR